MAAYGPWLADGADPTAGSLCTSSCCLLQCSCPARCKRVRSLPKKHLAEVVGKAGASESCWSSGIVVFSDPISLLVNAIPRVYKRASGSRIKETDKEGNTGTVPISIS